MTEHTPAPHTPSLGTPHVLTGRYAIVAYGSLPGALVMAPTRPTGPVTISTLRITPAVGDNQDEITLCGPTHHAPTWEAALLTAAQVAAAQVAITTAPTG